MTPEQQQQILSDVKLLLGITTDEKDALLTYHINSCVQKVLNYCNREDLPAALMTVIVEMTVKAYNAWIAGGAGTGSGVVATGVVSSVSRGDFSVSYDNSSEAVEAAQSLSSNDFINEYKLQLYQFKKVKLL